MRYIKQYDVLDRAIFEYDDIMYLLDILEVPENIMDIYLEDEEPSQDKMIIGYVRKENNRSLRNIPGYIPTISTGYQHMQLKDSGQCMSLIK